MIRSNRNAHRERWLENSSDKTGWQYPISDVRASASPFIRAVQITIWWPARRDARSGHGTDITPERARQLAAELLDVAAQAESGAYCFGDKQSWDR